jgi:hypothetical protein
MADEELSIDEARRRLIELIEAEDCDLTQAAVNDGREILRRSMRYPTRWAIVEYVLKLLRAKFPMHAVELGEPPGSLGIGYVMTNADGQGLYIKLRIEDDRLAWVLSFHTSKHYKG